MSPRKCHARSAGSGGGPSPCRMGSRSQCRRSRRSSLRCSSRRGSIAVHPVPS
ncbi:hypothetical protein F751_6323 [Auxenochlorella protothecoides]|uniref:Uncharacterized protein n=1 Tax=Auxenochlorella protothecoides TaxID=3075 RepID=A0A087SSU8_AUXPR|nr:hypothetical protein F751_6323 [Auxenochlorella protothecoides]KFM28802.1 hypothetical protein F751_6323 [Auxenochlorella protothecoides]